MTIKVIPHLLSDSAEWKQKDEVQPGNFSKVMDHAEQKAVNSHLSSGRMILLAQNAFPCINCHNTFVSKVKAREIDKLIISIQGDNGGYSEDIKKAVGLPTDIKYPCMLVYFNDGSGVRFINENSFSSLPNDFFPKVGRTRIIPKVPAQYRWE